MSIRAQSVEPEQGPLSPSLSSHSPSTSHHKGVAQQHPVHGRAGEVPPTNDEEEGGDEVEGGWKWKGMWVQRDVQDEDRTIFDCMIVCSLADLVPSLINCSVEFICPRPLSPSQFRQLNFVN